MLRTLCLILLTTFLICKATDVASILLLKSKMSVACDTGTCDNEKTEVEKMSDDQLFNDQVVHFDHFYLSIPPKNSFLYSISFRNDIVYNLLSPPPELI
ncbi:hypothetical protein [Dyadobacter crusticola]|uniref:hypothetical protein n=1 Tax=Dyadobacter crusticola TaxID=292407 RepID=UPI0004E283D3|nr:hypothetical protein [Dyadobacter crusticola]